MQIEAYMKIIHTAERLKDQTRHCYTSGGRHESVAEHSWRMTLMACFLKDEFPEADMDKVIRMCIFHDMGEIFTGDIPTFEKKEEHERVEEELLDTWVLGLPWPYREELAALFQEMKELSTQEAKIYKALDRMEAVIQHNESDIATWLPLEYDLQMTYGEQDVRFSEFMKKLKEEANRETREKIREAAKQEK